MKVTGSLIKLIIFAVITSMLTFVLAATIGNLSFTGNEKYRARFTDVTGLLVGDDIRIAGVKVGQVDSIKIVGKRYAEVGFDVEQDVKLRTTTVARVRYRNLVGQRYIELTEGAGAGQILPAHGLIPLSQTQPALDLTVLFNGFKPLFAALNPKDVNTLATEIIKVFQGEGGTFRDLLATTASLTNTIADRDKVVGDVVDNLNTVLGTVDKRDAALSNLILQFQRFVSGLSGDRQAILDSIGNINDLTASTAGLLGEIRAPLQSEIGSLGQISQTLETTKNPAGQNVLDEYLQRLPKKVNAIVRTATYGGWFNFYLCDFYGSGLTGSGPNAVQGRSNVNPCNGVVRR